MANKQIFENKVIVQSSGAEKLNTIRTKKIHLLHLGIRRSWVTLRMGARSQSAMD